MPVLDDYLMNHGEAYVQFLIEQIERVDGVKHAAPLSLEDRWLALNLPLSRRAA